MDRGTILEEAGDYGVLSTDSVFPEPVIWVQVVIDGVKAPRRLAEIHPGFAHRNSLERFGRSLFLIDTAAGHKQPVLCRRVLSPAHQTGRTGGDPPADPTKRKFALLDNATTLGDLAAVPGNNFEKYRDHRKGKYSIRIKRKYRLFFRWSDGNAYDVRLADEH